MNLSITRLHNQLVLAKLAQDTGPETPPTPPEEEPPAGGETQAQETAGDAGEPAAEPSKPATTKSVPGPVNPPPYEAPPVRDFMGFRSGREWRQALSRYITTMRRLMLFLRRAGFPGVLPYMPSLQSPYVSLIYPHFQQNFTYRGPYDAYGVSGIYQPVPIGSDVVAALLRAALGH